MIRKITRDQILAKSDRFLDAIFGTPAPDRFLPLDVAPIREADAHSIPKTIEIPLEDLERTARQKLDPGREIVVYESGGNPERTWSAARILEKLGYMNLFVYEGGISEWLSDDLNTETRLVPADHIALVGPNSPPGPSPTAGLSIAVIAPPTQPAPHWTWEAPKVA